MAQLKSVQFVRNLWHKAWVRWPVIVIVVAGVFTFGVFVGDGRVQVQLGAFTRSPSSTLPEQLDYSTVNDVYKSLKTNYNGKLTVTQLLDGLKEGLAQATGDQYTEYFNPNQAKEFDRQLNNSFSGIGAVLGKDDQGNVIIVSPIKGFPADKAGLKSQDIIASIDGQATASLAPDLAAAKIRGPKGTKVTLKIIRNKTEDLTFTITRDDIQLPSVTTKTLDGNIGYIQIRSFSDDTARLATEAANSFKAAQVKGIILDLRSNPGGLLDAAVSVSSLWLPNGSVVVSEKGTNGDQTLTANLDPVLQSIPTVVLINEGSASASEITAGALHDNKAAYIIGTKSFGKGVVQQLVQFTDGSELKVTIASWYRPNGQNINRKGITPDQTVELSDADSKAGNDTQLTAAQAYLSKR